jgi:coenzyme Q-binding protein COQ10
MISCSVILKHRDCQCRSIMQLDISTSDLDFFQLPWLILTPRPVSCSLPIMQASTSRSAVRLLSRTSQSTPQCASKPGRWLPTTFLPVSSSTRDPRRTFFSLPDISKLASLAQNAVNTPSNGSNQVETDGDIQKYHARKILPQVPPTFLYILLITSLRYTQSQLYSLVSDVPSYSSFIPFCTSSNVLTPDQSTGRRREVDGGWKPGEKDFDVEAELKVGFGGLEERYVSRVVGKPFESVTVSLRFTL